MPVPIDLELVAVSIVPAVRFSSIRSGLRWGRAPTDPSNRPGFRSSIEFLYPTGYEAWSPQEPSKCTLQDHSDLSAASNRSRQGQDGRDRFARRNRTREDSRKDDAFRYEVEEIEKALNAVLGRFTKLEDIATVVNTNCAKFDRAVAESNARRQDAWNKSLTLRALARPSSPMPPAIESALVNARRSVEKIRDHLSANDIMAADAEAAGGLTALTGELQVHVDQWTDC